MRYHECLATSKFTISSSPYSSGHWGWDLTCGWWKSKQNNRSISLMLVVGSRWMQKLQSFFMHVVYHYMFFACLIGMLWLRPSTMLLKAVSALDMRKLELNCQTGKNLKSRKVQDNLQMSGHIVWFPLYLAVGQMLKTNIL